MDASELKNRDAEAEAEPMEDVIMNNTNDAVEEDAGAETGDEKDDGDREHAALVEASRAKLQEIGKRVNMLTLKVSRSKERFRAQAVKVAANAWLQKALKRPLEGYSKVATTSLVEDHGVMVESLMREIINLDAVEAHGDAALRERRRDLVKRINNKVLPRADQALARAKKLATRDRDLRELFQEQHEKDEERQRQLEQLEKESAPEKKAMSDDDDDDGENDDDDDDDASMRNAQQSRQQEKQQKQQKQELRDQAKKTKAMKRPPAPAQAPLRYKIGENAEEATILCEVPADLTLRDVEVAFERRSGELEVRLPLREPAVFDVSAPRLNPIGTTYTLHNGVLRIAVPKRRPQRQYMKRQQPRMHPMQQPRHGYYDAPRRAWNNQFVPLWGL